MIVSYYDVLSNLALALSQDEIATIFAISSYSRSDTVKLPSVNFSDGEPIGFYWQFCFLLPVGVG
ncbi:hypothetical protein ACFSCX_08780 [Bacillus salitolerans]|uniref:Uncharacterized protein n=1 Tax=Bacillus salitolerans TaxID=1437434 RepID=A0ABW4LR94_9BACI